MGTDGASYSFVALIVEAGWAEGICGVAACKQAENINVAARLSRSVGAGHLLLRSFYPTEPFRSNGHLSPMCRFSRRHGASAWALFCCLRPIR